MTDITPILTVPELDGLRQHLYTADQISLDFETQSNESNLEDWHPHSRITSAAFTTEPGHAYVLPCSHPDGPWNRTWRKALGYVARAIQANSGVRLVAHNAKYDIRWFHSMTGIALENQVWWDTCMSSYILDENESHSLKNVAGRELDVPNWADVDLKDSESADLDSLMLYNGRDTDYTLQLVPIHKERLLEERRLARLFHYLGMPIIRTLIRVERNGLPIDIEDVRRRQKESEQYLIDHEGYLMGMAEQYGMDPEDYPTVTFASANAKWFQEFMLRAELPVIKRTKTGNPSWAQDVLEELGRQGYDVALKILKYRQHSNRLSKFFIPWTQKLAEDGRLHPTFNPMRTPNDYESDKGTVTGRLSSSNPNAQQIARDLKPCFGGTDGWWFVEADYSQIELRVAAMVANDENMIKALNRGDDLHRIMASSVLDKDPKEIDDEERHKMGKTPNFGFLYDMSAESFVVYARAVYGVEYTLAEAKTVRRAFFNQWADIQRWHHRQANLAYRYGYVRNPLGRKRRLPEIRSSSNYLVGRAERQAINSPVQSFASDLMLLSLIEIDRQANPDTLRIVGTVHDSVLLELRDGTVDDNLDLVTGIMLDPCIGPKFGAKLTVPLEVECKIGRHWGDEEATVRVYQ